VYYNHEQETWLLQTHCASVAVLNCCTTVQKIHMKTPVIDE